MRGGMLGGILSWIGFTLPSVLLLMGFAWLISSTGSFDSGWISGLKIVAVAIVAHALIGMGKSLTPDRQRITIAMVAAILTLMIPTASGQIFVIIGAGYRGLCALPKRGSTYRQLISRCRLENGRKYCVEYFLRVAHRYFSPPTIYAVVTVCDI